VEIFLPTSVGDAVDRMVILEIKFKRFFDIEKSDRCLEQYKIILECIPKLNTSQQEMVVELRRINGDLWDVEDDIREAIKSDAATLAYVLSKRIIELNGKRTELKNLINQSFGSIVEDKQYGN
jgi:hypothetical protein